MPATATGFLQNLIDSPAFFVRIMDDREIQQVREYARRVEQLLVAMEIPPLEPTWESEPPGVDYTNRVARRMASEQAKVLRPLKVKYREKVVAILEKDWEPIADIIEEFVPHTLGKLEGWRKDILDHTDPAREHAYWLEPRDGKLAPNKHLKDTIDKLAGKLRSKADYVERTIRQPNGQGQASERADPIATAEAIIAKLEFLCKRPPGHTKLREDEEYGTFGVQIGGTVVNFFGHAGWLWHMQTREPAGRVLEQREMEEATAGVDDLLRYLRRSGLKEAAESVQEARDAVQRRPVVVYSERGPKNNPLVHLQHALELAIGHLSKARATEQGDRAVGNKAASQTNPLGPMSRPNGDTKEALLKNLDRQESAGGKAEPAARWKQIMQWTENYIKQHATDAPTGFNALLRLVIREFGRCGIPTLKKAISNSSALQAWEKKTKEWADNKKRASKSPDSLDEALRPDDSGHLRDERDKRATRPDEEADNRARIKQLCSMSLEELLKKTKGIFQLYVKWQNESGGGHRRDPDKEWQKVVSDPNVDVSDEESVARLYLLLRQQCAEILRHDPRAHSDPVKRRYLDDLPL